MRVLYVTPYFSPAAYYGEAVENAYRLSLGCARLGCSVRVLATDADGPRRTAPVETGKPILIDAGFEAIYAHRILFGAFAPSLPLRLLMEVRRAEVVHLIGLNVATALPALIACKIFDRPLVWSPGGALQPWRGDRSGLGGPTWLERMLAPRRVVMHAASEGERDACAVRIPAVAIATVPYGVRIPSKSNREPGKGRLRIGYAGRIEPRKALENLIGAAALLRDSGTSVAMTIAGEGGRRYLRLLRKRIERLGLGGEVSLIESSLRGSARRRFFDRINLFVLPSHQEHSAASVAEALARGVPVIASEGTPWSALSEHGCGLWVKNDPESLAGAIQRLAAMPLDEMGARGRDWIKRDFDWKSSARKMCDLYAALIFQRPLPDFATAAAEVQSGHTLAPAR